MSIPTIRSQQQSGVSITIGILSAVLSSLCQSIGLILQRKSHLRDKNSHPSFRKPPYKRRLWKIGLLLFLVSNIVGSSIQITTLPLIILSPLQSVGLVFNSLFSSLILREVFTQNSLIGTILIGIGAFLIAMFGCIPEPNYNLDQFIDFLKKKRFISWCILNLIIVVSLLIWVLLSINSELFIKEVEGDSEVDDDEDEEDEEEEESIVLENDNYINSTTSNEYEHFQQGDTYENSKINKILKDQLKTSKRLINKAHTKIYKRFFRLSLKNSALLQGIGFGWISGTLSGFSLLLAKSAIEILINCITSKSNLHTMLGRPMIWIIISSFLVLCLSQLWFLNQGLKLITTSILYPLVFCIYNIVNIGNELIFYNQWAMVTIWQLFNICLGTLLVFAGVLLLSWRLDIDGEPVEESTPLLRQDRAFHHHHHNHHQRNFSLESSNTTNKRVGLSSILHLNNNNNNNNNNEDQYDPERSSLKSPIFKNYFTFNNNNTSSTPSQRTPIKNKKLSINTSFIDNDLENDDDYDDDQEEGHSEYISFGSPNNKYSPPSTVESQQNTLQQQDILLSPGSNHIRKQSMSTPTKLKYEINGFHTTDIDQSSNISISSNTVESNHTVTPKKKYGSIGNIFSTSQQPAPAPQQQQQNQKRNSRRMLSFEQSELLGQLKNGLQ